MKMKKLRNISNKTQTLTIVRPTSTYTKRADPLEYVLLTEEEYSLFLRPRPPLDPKIWFVTDEEDTSPLPPEPAPYLPGLFSDGIPEGIRNLYYTDLRARTAVLRSEFDPEDTLHTVPSKTLYQLLNSIKAKEVAYDNTASGLAATNMQDALDELAATKLSSSGGSFTGILVPGPTGLKIGDSLNPNKYYETSFFSQITLEANKNAIIGEFSLPISIYSSTQIMYDIKDVILGSSRVGTLCLAHDGSQTSINDFFTETDDQDLSFRADVLDGVLTVSYSNGDTPKQMKAVVVKM